MVGTSSSSSSSSSASFGSFDDVTAAKPSVVKFLCSYGGKIIPRYPDGKLRYLGGATRVLAVNRSVPFSELQVKMGELCGWGPVSLRCQLPNEDLDALISVTSDEDLANLFEEYDLTGRDRLLPLKIRAFLLPLPPKAPKSPSPPPPPSVRAEHFVPVRVAHRCVHQTSPPSRFSGRPTGDQRLHAHHHNGSSRPRQFLVHHGNHWQ